MQIVSINKHFRKFMQRIDVEDVSLFKGYVYFVFEGAVIHTWSIMIVIELIYTLVSGYHRSPVLANLLPPKLGCCEMAC